MENQVGDFKISRKQIIHTFDFNNDYQNVEFTHVMTTDCYRRGRPYKLFRFNGGSQVQITFDLPENVKKPTRLHLTVTEGCWSGMMDIFLNDTLWIERHKSAGSNWQTREITLEVDRERLRAQNNSITMKLREDAVNVYWLADAIIEVTYTVPSTLVDITANAVARMIRNGQIPEEVINIKQNLPTEVANIIYEWM
ncbi:uncharacterized protein LOC110045946 [Orbicella faveolata]|uniref:uncharacterized protein LOC110045946 n=1 Tax=Orbicella faveolata TaxID=48498 RepID=UPI0009E48D75|nr:uncharacterized protein LOC110045946 [Orbicella faveolata]